MLHGSRDRTALTPRASISAALWLGLALALVAPVSGVQAQSPSLRDRLLGWRNQNDPAVARYTAQGVPRFTLDRTGARHMLRFDNNSEVWVLSVAAGPRGDIIYRNDVGQTVLRAGRMGGLTIYSPSTPAGVPAALAGRAQAIAPMAPMSRGDFALHLIGLSNRAGSVIRRLLVFDAPRVGEAGRPVAADAATLAQNLVLRTDAPVRVIRLVEGSRPDAVLANGILIVTFVPGQGYAGRPSSARMARAIQVGRR